MASHANCQGARALRVICGRHAAAKCCGVLTTLQPVVAGDGRVEGGVATKGRLLATRRFVVLMARVQSADGN